MGMLFFVLPNEPFTPSQAKKLAVAILGSGTVIFTGHARRELKKDGLSEADAINTIRGGVYEPAEFENGSWRYRTRTHRMYAVIEFDTETALIVITGWRTGR